MNIFAAAADYASWITLLGVKPGDDLPNPKLGLIEISLEA